MIRTPLTVLTVLTVLNACTHKRSNFRVTQQPAAPVQSVMQRQVRNAVDAGDGDLTARRLRERVMAEPRNEELRIQLAEHYRQAGLNDLAIEYLRLGVERFPQSERMMLRLTESLYEQKEFVEAAAQLEGFLNRRPSTAGAAWLGIVRDEQGNWKAGESAHRAALAQNPVNARVRNNLGYNLLQQGKRTEAIAELRQAVAQDPAMAAAHNNLAMALARGSRQERGEALAQWRMMSDPAAAHSNLGAVLIEQGAYVEARQEIQAALGLRPDLPQALHNLKLVSELDGKPAELLPGVSASTQAPRKDAGFKAAMKKVWFVVAGVDQKPVSHAQPATGSE